MGCLTAVAVKKLKAGLAEQGLFPVDMAKKTTEERRAVFEKILGPDLAVIANQKFEGALVKRRVNGLREWVQKIKEPAVKADVISSVNKLSEERVLDPVKMQSFYADYVAQKLGFAVSSSEAKELMELAKIAKEAKEKIDPTEGPWGSSRRTYGSAAHNFTVLRDKLKLQSEMWTKEKMVSEWKKNPGWMVGNTIVETGGFFKAIWSSFDVSALGRQGYLTMLTHPDIWAKNARQTFIDIHEAATKKEDVIAAVMADILSRENVLNGKALKEGLAVGVMEEAFPTSLPEQIPLFGGAYKVSQDVYTAFLYRVRMDIFDRLVEQAEKAGVDYTGIGTLVNSMTGRGDLGKRNENVVNFLNKIFFSPRNVKGILDTLTAHTGNREMGAFAKEQARTNLLKLVVFSAILLKMLEGLGYLLGEEKPVEWDMRSADFGKFRIGDTRFAVTAQFAPYIVLASRLVTGTYKSSTTGKLAQLDTGAFGSMSRWEMVHRFLDGKLAPTANIVKSFWEADELEGTGRVAYELLADDTVQREGIALWVGRAIETFTPLGINDAFKSGEEFGLSPMAAATIAANTVGIGTQTYHKEKRKAKKQSGRLFT